MPNWCNNWVEVGHEDPAKIKALAEAYNRGEFCDHVVPVPEILKNPETTTSYGDPDKQANADRIREEALKATGYESWYDFCVAKWGTKWDISSEGVDADITDDGKAMTAGFDTAWSPPTGIYEALVEQGYTVRAYYYEPGMAYAGIYDNGSDDYMELGGMSAKEVEAVIDSDLDEMFGITEQMYEYEAENEEDLTKWVREGGEALKLETK